MGNSPSITGLDRGGAHGRRDIVRDGSRAEQRPTRFQADESESELAGSRSDIESNRKSRVDNAPEPVSGYSGACNVGLRCLGRSHEQRLPSLAEHRL